MNPKVKIPMAGAMLGASAGWFLSRNKKSADAKQHAILIGTIAGAALSGFAFALLYAGANAVSGAPAA